MAGPEEHGRFLFLGIGLGGPIEELEATLDRKVRVYNNLGEKENAERLSAAYRIARAKLEAVLAASRATIGS